MNFSEFSLLCQMLLEDWLYSLTAISLSWKWFIPIFISNLDLYQITMSYAYWRSGKMNDHAVFDLYFRKNPFKGEFTIFAGLEEVVKFLHNFSFSDSGKNNYRWKIN